MPGMNDDLWHSNQRAFESTAAADWYAGQPLSPGEALSFLLYADRIRGGRILDLGVGSGRTTRYLLPLAARYAAIDPSQAMRERLLADFPGTDVRDGDMRRIDTLGDETFDVVVASSGVLDAFEHEDRLLALEAVRGRLVPGGIFIFSGHNRDHPRAGQGPASTRLAWNAPWRAIGSAIRYLRDTRNMRRLSHFRRDQREYSLLSDAGHHWSLVVYYMSAPAQLRQLAGAGFACLAAFADEGARIDPEQAVSTTPMIHYVVRRVEG